MYCNFRWPRGTNIQSLSEQLIPATAILFLKVLKIVALKSQKEIRGKNIITPANDSWKKTFKKEAKNTDR